MSSSLNFQSFADEKKRLLRSTHQQNKGPSIYDVHTEGERLRWTHVDGGRGPAPCGRPHRKLKLESNDVTLSSSHAKKLASFLPEFRLWTEKKWKFFCDRN